MGARRAAVIQGALFAAVLVLMASGAAAQPSREDSPFFDPTRGGDPRPGRPPE